jgi:hypothetical protein
LRETQSEPVRRKAVLGSEKTSIIFPIPRISN